ncbi:MAG TPA: hypothetical protein HPQ04_07460 [Rhodospirillaceae bacterium]|nr:hypothetical protein [Rhodospirillaceae bacterium]
MTRRTERIVVLLFVAAAMLVHIVKFLGVADTELTVWGDRDLWRALEIANQWPILGPETNGGLRTPGGAFYLLLAAGQAVAPGYLSANILVLALFAGASAVLGLVVGRDVSPLAGAVTAAAFAGSGLLWQALGIWNPGYLPFFAAVLSLSVFRFLTTGAPLPLALAAASLAFGLQIHLQISTLAAGLLLAALLARPRLTWRHGLAALTGFVLPYLPTLSADAFRLLAAAAALPGEAVATYGSLAFDWMQKLTLVYEVFGGTGTAMRSPGPWGLALDGGDLLAVGLGAAALVSAVWTGWRQRRLPADGVFAVAVTVYLGISMVTFVNLRHMVAVVPAAAVAVGLAADRLYRWTAGRGIAARAATAAVLLLLAARPLALAVSGLSPVAFSPESALAQQEIAATLKPSFYAGHQAFEDHAALFQRTPRGSLLLVQGGIADHLASIYRTTPAAATAADRDDCLAILPRAAVTGDPRPQLSAAMRGITPRFDATPPLESAHFLYFPYTTEDGNCLKTFPNAYIPAGGEGEIGVSIETAGAGRYRAVLVGRGLRGYTGLPFRALSAPVLCLAGDGPGVVVQPLARLTVGSPQAGTLAPWRSPDFALPDGRYRLWLTAFDERKGRAVEMPLDGVSLPGAVRTADAGPLPDGCPRAKR